MGWYFNSGSDSNSVLQGPPPPPGHPAGKDSSIVSKYNEEETEASNQYL